MNATATAAPFVTRPEFEGRLEHPTRLQTINFLRIIENVRTVLLGNAYEAENNADARRYRVAAEYAANIFGQMATMLAGGRKVRGAAAMNFHGAMPAPGNVAADDYAANAIEWHLLALVRAADRGHAPESAEEGHLAQIFFNICK